MTRTRRGGVHPVWLWRWRSNPLRRRCDVADAWLLLLLWCFAVAAGAVVGAVTAQGVERTVNDRRSERHAVTAVLVRDAREEVSTTAGTDNRAWAEARWTEPDGSSRTALAPVEPGTEAGATAQVWLDREGHVVSAPVNGDEAAIQGAVMGTATAVGAAVVVLSVGWFVRGRLARRRLARWDTEWERVGPQWGRTTG